MNLTREQLDQAKAKTKENKPRNLSKNSFWRKVEKQTCFSTFRRVRERRLIFIRLFSTGEDRVPKTVIVRVLLKTGVIDEVSRLKLPPVSPGNAIRTVDNTTYVLSLVELPTDSNWVHALCYTREFQNIDKSSVAS